MSAEPQDAIFISRQTKLITKVRLPLYLPEELYNRLCSASLHEGLSMSAKAVQIIREALK